MGQTPFKTKSAETCFYGVAKRIQGLETIDASRGRSVVASCADNFLLHANKGRSLSSAIQAFLLVSQRVNRIQVSRLLGGVKTEEDADGAGEEKGDRDDRRIDKS